MTAMHDGSTKELRCYAYQRGDVWAATCTDYNAQCAWARGRPPEIARLYAR